jgi:hypothetical protein
VLEVRKPVSTEDQAADASPETPAPGEDTPGTGRDGTV